MLPDSSIAQIVSDYDEALALDPGNVDIWKPRTMLHVDRMFRALCRNQDPIPAYEDARTSLEELLRLEPSQPGIWLLKVSLCLNWGRYRASRNQDPVTCYREAVRCADRAMEIGPRSWESLQGRVLGVSFHLAWLTQQNASGDEVAGLTKEYGRDTAELLQVAPAIAEHHILRADYYRRVESWAESLRELEEAVRLDPARATPLSKEMGDCRDQLRKAPRDR